MNGIPVASDYQSVMQSVMHHQARFQFCFCPVLQILYGTFVRPDIARNKMLMLLGDI